jgi:ABC-type transport system substrate-binding protein
MRVNAALSVAALLGLSASLYACGGGGSSSSSAAACDPNAAITMADFTPSPTVDPIRSIGPCGDGTKEAVYDPLVRYIAGSGPGAGLQPALATAWKAINPTLIDLTLRKGVSFTDGTQFNAAAVKVNLDRAKSDPRAGANIVTAMANVQSVNVINDYEVQVQLKNPQPAWLANVTWGPGFMVSPKAFSGGTNLDVTAVGTGPFKLTKFTTSVAADYVRNDGYWNTAFIKCAPREFHLLESPDTSAQLNGLISGQLSVGYLAPAVVAQAKSARLTVKTTPGPASTSIYFNRGRAPFNNETVRQALMYAIDRDALAKGIYHGLANPDVQLLPTFSESYNAGANYQPKAYAYNPTKAKQMLAQAGFPNGVSFVFVAQASTPVDQDAAQAMQQQMAAAGFKATIQPIPNANTFFGGTGDAYLAAQSGRVDDTDSMESAIGNSLLNPGKVPLASDWSTLLADTRTLDFGSAKRKSQEQQLDGMITDHAWIVPVLTVDKVYGVSTCIQNFKPSLTGAYQPVALQAKQGCKFP